MEYRVWKMKRGQGRFCVNFAKLWKFGIAVLHGAASGGNGNKRVQPVQASPPLCHGFIPEDEELAGFGRPRGKEFSQGNPTFGQEKPKLGCGSCRICDCMARMPSAMKNQEIPSKQIHRISNKSQEMEESEGGKQVIHQHRENLSRKTNTARGT